jgi:hypothetical protein
MQMEAVLKALKKFMGDKNEALYKMNHKALDQGIKWIQGTSK